MNLHQYDDDLMLTWNTRAPGSQVGDPCIWCDHDKEDGEP